MQSIHDSTIPLYNSAGLIIFMKSRFMPFVLILSLVFFIGCTQQAPDTGSQQESQQDTGDTGTPTQWSIVNDLGTRYGIFIMDSDGTDVEQIYGSDNVKLTNALASPDGNTIVFFEQTGGIEGASTTEISVINIDGTGYRKLTDNNWMDFQPVWSSDGTEILFISNNGGTAGTDIYVMDENGNILRQLTDTPGMTEADPDWKCGKIVFTRNGTIWIMDEDGSNEQQLTDPPGRGIEVGVQFALGDYDPNLSPDCSKVAFERLTGTGYEVSGVNIGDYDLYVYDISSETETDISQNDVADLLPEWSGDGTKLIFMHLSNVIDDLYDIYMINADGTGRTKVTGNDPIGFTEDSCTWFGNRVIFTAETFE